MGILDYRDADMVIVDIPGLIEGAHEGVGLGHDFREPDRGSFYEYLIFFDDSLCDHHHIASTLSE